MNEFLLFSQNLLGYIQDPLINESDISRELGNEDSTMYVITRFTFLFFIFLIIAVFVERLVEIFMSAVKYADMKLGWHKFWNARAYKIRRKLDQLYSFQGSGAEDKKKLLTWIFWKVVTDKPYEGGKEIIAASSIRFNSYRFISRIFAFVISLCFAIFMHQYRDLDLIELFEKVGEINMGHIPSAFRVILTAAILAAGSEPLHQAISKFENLGKPSKTA